MLILRIEIPLLKIIFKAAGSLNAESRNSINEPEYFNVFMSDLDFTLSAEEKNFHFLFQVSSTLKKIFLNLGELELYTPQEWDHLQNLQRSEFWHYWKKIYLIRKTNWQRLKLKQDISPYEAAKQTRSLALSLKKLQHDRFPLDGKKIFPELIGKEKFYLPLPFFSHFLELTVTQINHNETRELFFSSPQEASGLLAVLPDNDFIPGATELRKIKKLIIEREFLLALTSLRLQQFKAPEKKFPELHSWLKKLKLKTSRL